MVLRKHRAVQANDRGKGPARCFVVGGLVFEFEHAPQDWILLASMRYQGFETDAPATFTVTYRVDREAEIDPLALAAGHRAEPAVLVHRGAFELTGLAFSAGVDLERGRITIDGPRAVYPLDLVLRFLLTELAEDSLIVHAAALAEGVRGWICAGPPGCGKSTLAGLFPGKALCDELALVRVDDDRVEVEALPFWNATPGRAVLRGIHLLRHGIRDRRDRLPGTTALRQLGAQVLWPVHRREALGRAFELLAELVERVPVWDLAFRPRQDVWRLIAGEEHG